MVGPTAQRRARARNRHELVALVRSLPRTSVRMPTSALEALDSARYHRDGKHVPCAAHAVGAAPRERRVHFSGSVRQKEINWKITTFCPAGKPNTGGKQCTARRIEGTTSWHNEPAGDMEHTKYKCLTASFAKRDECVLKREAQPREVCFATVDFSPSAGCLFLSLLLLLLLLLTALQALRLRAKHESMCFISA